MAEFNRIYPFRHGQAHKVLVNIHDVCLRRFVQVYGEYSEAEVELCRAMIRPGDTVLNIGANCGFHTLALSDLVGPSGWVLAYEPQQMAFQALCANLALNSVSNVCTYPYAVGETAGIIKVPFLDPTRDQNTGGLSLAHPYLLGLPTRMITLDGMLLPEPNSNTDATFALIDVEAMEPEVIRGAARFLRSVHPVLYLEWAWNREEILNLLEDAGYRCWYHGAQMGQVSNYLGAPTAREDMENVSPMLLAVHPESTRQIPESAQSLRLIPAEQALLQFKIEEKAAEAVEAEEAVV